MTVAATHMSWELRAACRGHDAGLFMPPLGRETAGERKAREHAAKKVCVHCPVRSECLDYALRVHEPIGIWGGLNEAERRELTRSESASC
jgi:WhiB family redox-sensing transcriptional regulator